MTSQAAPLTPHVEHMAPADAYVCGYEAALAAEKGEDERLAGSHARKLSAILDRVDDIEKQPRWVPPEPESAEDEALRIANGDAA
jgi:uncharacterized protein YbjT (DUF2867 family)